MGVHATATELMVETAVTVIVAEPKWVASWVDVAVMVAVPVVDGVKTPLAVMVPRLVGLTDHVTALLKSPVPATVDAQAEVWFA